MAEQKLSWRKFKKMKANGEKIAMLTAYDFSAATLAEKSGVDILLVGDSLGNVVLGYGNTLPVTIEDMIHHTKAVVRGAKNTMIAVDMPFGSYEVSNQQGVTNAIHLLKSTGCDGVKLEGGAERASLVADITAAGVPVVGHIGLTPQKVVQMGGFIVQGKTTAMAKKIMDDARALEAAGAEMIVLECVPAELAQMITQSIEIPTIGIGAGPHCDGQVLVWYDMLGMYDGFKPKFVKRFADAGKLITQGMTDYVNEVHGGQFPSEEHCFAMNQDEALDKLY